MRARRRTVFVVALSIAFGLLASSLAPVVAAQTVDEIIKRGKVIIGVNTTTPVFGLMGKDASPRDTIPTSPG